MKTSRNHIRVATPGLIAAQYVEVAETTRTGLQRLSLVVFRLLAVLLAVLPALCSSASAQERSDPPPTELSIATPRSLRPGQIGKLYVQLPQRSVQGIRFDFPGDYEVLGVVVESYQEGTLETQVRFYGNSSSGTVLWPEPLLSPAVAVVSFRAGLQGREQSVSVTPLTLSDGGRITDLGTVTSRRVAVRPQPATLNSVLEMKREGSTLEVEDRRLRNLDSDSPFTVAAWVNTTDNGGVLLSSWTGREADAYPIELIIGMDGRAVFYRGREGEHQSMRSRQPVADGSWHHIAVTSDPANECARLFVDGVAADSLMTSFSGVSKGLRLMIGGRIASDETKVGGRAPRHRGLINGAVDDVAFWTESLDRNRIARISGGDVSSVGAPIILQTFSDADRLEGRLPAFVSLRREATFDEAVFQSLSGKISDGSVELSWQSFLSDTDQFIVERSLDGKSFQPIGSVGYRSSQETYSFRDPFINAEVLYYRIVQTLGEAESESSAIIKVGLADPMETSEVFLTGNAPNPFSVSTTINYKIPEAGYVEISIWDVAGQPIRTLVDVEKAAGSYEVVFSAGELSAGTYFVRMKYDGQVESAKVLLVK